MDNFNNDSNYPPTTSAYGAGGASGQFDLLTFVKKPQVIVRMISLLFAIIVASCIASQGWEADICKFNNCPSTCNFGVFLGVVAIIVLCVFLVLDFLFDNISNVMKRKYVVIADIISSAFTAFLWFACFCNLVDKWRYTTNLDSLGGGGSAMEASIAFSFFSIASFGVLTGLAIKRYKEGVTEGLHVSDYNNPDNFAPTEDNFTP